MVRQSLTGWRSVWRGAAAGLLVGLVVVGVLAAHLLDPVYDGLQDHVIAGIDNDPSVTLVAIDQRSSDKLAAGSWPWSNAIHARVIDHPAKLHPKAILVDIVLNRSGEEPEADGQLADSIRRAGNVVLACTADDAPKPEFAQWARFVGDRGLSLPDAAT